jgi:hypothetical protein
MFFWQTHFETSRFGFFAPQASWLCWTCWWCLSRLEQLKDMRFQSPLYRTFVLRDLIWPSRLQISGVARSVNQVQYQGLDTGQRIVIRLHRKWPLSSHQQFPGWFGPPCPVLALLTRKCSSQRPRQNHAAEGYMGYTVSAKDLWPGVGNSDLPIHCPDGDPLVHPPCQQKGTFGLVLYDSKVCR